MDSAVALTSVKINPQIRHNCVLVLHSKPASVKILSGKFHFWSTSVNLKFAPQNFPTIWYNQYVDYVHTYYYYIHSCIIYYMHAYLHIGL